MTNQTTPTPSTTHDNENAVSERPTVPETPPTPEPEAINFADPAAASADAEAPVKDKQERKENKRKTKSNPASKERTRGTAGDNEDRSGAASSQPLSLTDKLLARLEIPRVALDRRLLPAPLLAALDSADLGAPDLLPSSVFITLAAVGAVAGPVQYTDGTEGATGGNVSLRVALLTSSRRSPLVAASILGGVYAAENAALDKYTEAVQRHRELRRGAEQRRRLHEQTVRTAAVLGLPTPAPLPDVAIVEPGPRPRIVVADGAGSAIHKAAAGGTGVFVIDERRASWMAGVGDFYDAPTDALLNAAAAGRQIPIAEPVSGRVTMRTFPASAVGALCIAECSTLHNAGPAQLQGTVFVPAKPPTEAGDSTALDALMRRVHVMAGGPITLRMPPKTLVSAAAAWDALAAQTLPPMSDYLARLPDLTRRLAGLLHLTAAAGGDGVPLATDIPLATVKRALAIVDTCVVPAAWAVLGPVSTVEMERDARRIIQHLRATTSAARPFIDRRQLLRAWPSSLGVPELDAALDLLQKAGLFVAVSEIDGKPVGGQHFQIAAPVYAAA